VEHGTRLRRGGTARRSVPRHRGAIAGTIADRSMHLRGVGAVRAREIREGLRRLQEHNLVDRYLQL